jgi:hypothetical protein
MNTGRCKRFSLSLQRGEGRGEGWERREALELSASFHRTTPHLQSLSPLRGEGSRKRAVDGGEL